jgi:hypothetical protein
MWTFHGEEWHRKEDNAFCGSKIALTDSALTVLVLNIKCVSSNISGEKDKSDKPPTSNNKMKVLEVNAELL